MIKNSCNTRREALTQACQTAPVELKKSLRTRCSEIENELAFWNHKIAVVKFTIIETAAERLGEVAWKVRRAALNSSFPEKAKAVSVWENSKTKAGAVKAAYETAGKVASESWEKAVQQDIKEFWNNKLGEIESKIARWKGYAELAEQKRQECLSAAAQEAAAFRQGVQDFLDSLIEEVGAKYDAWLEG